MLWRPNLYLRIYFCIFSWAFNASAPRLLQSNDLPCPVFLPRPWPAPGVLEARHPEWGSALQQMITAHPGESFPLSGHQFLVSQLVTRAELLFLGLRSAFQALLRLSGGQTP